VCHHLFDEKHASQLIDLSHVSELAYKDLLPLFEHIWRPLSESEQELSTQKVQAPSAAIQERPELTESALFRQFLCTHSRASTFEITVEDVEAALDKMNDSRALGDSPLRYLSLVTQRSSKETQTITTSERARIIRELLTQAFERMRGIDPRRDEARDWISYNVLYYRYFNKSRMTNNQIARRILCSNRQYYREKQKAINMLFQELVEMDASQRNNLNT
jgi:hypothetical protein